MAAGSTYTPIQTQTVSGSTTTGVSFNSISGSYTDLRIVINGGTTVNGYSYLLSFNGDNASGHYSQTALIGNGSAASSSRGSNLNVIYLGWSVPAYADAGSNNILVDVMNYSNTTTYKTVLFRQNNNYSGASGTEADAALFRSTSAISSISLVAGSGYINAGATFTLYGILAA